MERKALEPQEVTGLAISLMGELHMFFSRIEAKSSGKIDCLKRAYTLCASAILAWGLTIAVLVNR